MSKPVDSKDVKRPSVPAGLRVVPTATASPTVDGWTVVDSKKDNDSGGKADAKQPAKLSSSIPTKLSQLPSGVLAKCAAGADPATALREEILRLRSSRTELADHKRYYISSGDTAWNGTQASWILCAPSTGTESDQRLSTSVRAHSVRIKLAVYRNAAPGTAADDGTGAYPPVLSVTVFREKVPTSIGSVPAVYATDVAGPPTNVSALYSYQGTAKAAVYPANMFTAVPNPRNAQAYHVYRHDVQHVPNALYPSYNGATVGAYCMGFMHFWEAEIPLNGVRVDWAEQASAGTSVLINSICLAIEASTFPGGYNANLHYVLTSECVFEDIDD